MAQQISKTDREHMGSALALARRGLGTTWPNPSVGCVLVKDGLVLGRGRTARGGRPHAETSALAQAAARGQDVAGATAYVTLEPCSHHGKTPPCADALVAARIARVVIAALDPDPRVNGGGMKRLQDAGIAVDVGVMAEEASEVNQAFFTRVRSGRPLVTLKIASSLDGGIATAGGESRWISGPESRAMVHALRAESDAIIIGSGTAAIDNPDLTCRLPGLEWRSPVRVVVDGRLRMPLTSRLIATARDVPTWVLTRADADAERAMVLRECGVEIVEVDPGPDGKIDLAAAFTFLGEKGLTSALVEAGGHLAAAMFRQDLVDRLAWFHAPMVLGGDAIPAAVGFGLHQLDRAPRFARQGTWRTGNDIFAFMKRE